MMQYHLEHTYIFAENVRLFTAILLPEKNGKFPTILVRSPYVDNCEELDETDALLLHLNENVEWLKRGYAVVLQHCRGRGKSEGDCVPYIHEREDGLAL